MKNIFADLYNRVMSFFYKSDNEVLNAKDTACSRLKLVLMQDRTNLTPVVMERMKKELIELLSKYIELDKELLDLNFEQEDNQMALMLSIPVVRAKSETEIQAIIDKEEMEKQRLDDLSIALGEVNEADKPDEEKPEEIIEENTEPVNKDNSIKDEKNSEHAQENVQETGLPEYSDNELSKTAVEKSTEKSRKTVTAKNKKSKSVNETNEKTQKIE